MVQTSRRARASDTSKRKSRNNRLLLVVDESRRQIHAVEIPCESFSKPTRSFRYASQHSLPPLPSELLEFGGAEDPYKERQLSSRLKAEQQQWIAG